MEKIIDFSRPVESILRELKIDRMAANNFLENLDSKVFIDPCKDQNKQVEGFIYSFMEDFLKYIETMKCPNHGIQIIKSGSYYANLRLGNEYEFDYMLLIPTPEAIKCTQEDGLVFVKYQEIDEKYPDIPDIHVALMLKTMAEDFIETLTYKESVTINHKQSLLGASVCMEMKYKIGEGITNISFDMVPCFVMPQQLYKTIHFHQPFLDLLKYVSIKKPYSRVKNFDFLNLVCSVQSTNKDNNPVCLQRNIKRLGGEDDLEKASTKTNYSSSSYARYSSESSCHEDKTIAEKDPQNEHFNDYLLLVKRKMAYRVSASILENALLMALNRNVLTAFRLVKYMVQTFHSSLWVNKSFCAADKFPPVDMDIFHKTNHVSYHMTLMLFHVIGAQGVHHFEHMDTVQLVVYLLHSFSNIDRKSATKTLFLYPHETSIKWQMVDSRDTGDYSEKMLYEMLGTYLFTAIERQDNSETTLPMDPVIEPITKYCQVCITSLKKNNSSIELTEMMKATDASLCKVHRYIMK